MKISTFLLIVLTLMGSCRTKRPNEFHEETKDEKRDEIFVPIAPEDISKIVKVTSDDTEEESQQGPNAVVNTNTDPSSGNFTESTSGNTEEPTSNPSNSSEDKSIVTGGNIALVSGVVTAILTTIYLLNKGKSAVPSSQNPPLGNPVLNAGPAPAVPPRLNPPVNPSPQAGVAPPLPNRPSAVDTNPSSQVKPVIPPRPQSTSPAVEVSPNAGSQAGRPPRPPRKNINNSNRPLPQPPSVLSHKLAPEEIPKDLYYQKLDPSLGKDGPEIAIVRKSPEENTIVYRSHPSAQPKDFQVISRKISELDNEFNGYSKEKETDLGFERPYPIEEGVILEGGLKMPLFRKIPEGKTHQYKNHAGERIYVSNIGGNNLIITTHDIGHFLKKHAVVSKGQNIDVYIDESQLANVEMTYDMSSTLGTQFWDLIPAAQGKSTLLLNAGDYFQGLRVGEQRDFNGNLVTVLHDGHVLLTQTKTFNHRQGRVDPANLPTAQDSVLMSFIGMPSDKFKEIRVYISQHDPDFKTLKAIYEDSDEYSLASILNNEHLEVGSSIILMNGVDRFSMLIQDFPIGKVVQYPYTGIEIRRLDRMNVLIKQYKPVGLPTSLPFQ